MKVLLPRRWGYLPVYRRRRWYYDGGRYCIVPANLASISGIAIWDGLFLHGAMSGMFMPDWRQKNPWQGGPNCLCRKYLPFGFQTGVLYYHANWIGNSGHRGITAVSYFIYSFFRFS